MSAGLLLSFQPDQHQAAATVLKLCGNRVVQPSLVIQCRVVCGLLLEGPVGRLMGFPLSLVFSTFGDKQKRQKADVDKGRLSSNLVVLLGHLGDT